MITKKVFILLLLLVSIVFLNGCEKREYNGDYVIAIQEVNQTKLHKISHYIEYQDKICIVNNDAEEVCWEKRNVDIYRIK